MTIEQAIAKLQATAAKHGNINVYFDCPRCGLSFTPDIVVGIAVHMAGCK